MHSLAISFLAAAATLTTAVRAAPTIADTPAVEARAAYYVCNNNGFRGDCTVDPCAISWCPDYKPFTYEPVTTPTPAPAPTPAPVPVPGSTTSFYVCFNNGFRGDCSIDPCALSWCPNYYPGTYTPIDQVKRSSDPTVCAPGTGFFQSCSNGFRGCCTTDACGPAGWCPNYYFGSYTPVVQVKRDAAADPTVCAPGTGFFQACSNGFRGCCKSDACGQAGWCADYKFGSYTPVAPVVVKAVEAAAVVPGNNGVCPPNTGFFQVCANGFRGCCKKDACAGKAAVCPA
ncbi:hypothetical protein QBC39DRAFT_376922 [Podospora conica]|nr:hypothetical protein QBC39DRAFT_376922 [Schizothecium conicum]